IGLNHVDLPEARRRAAVAHRIALRRLALSVIGGSPLLPIAGAGDQVAGLPEIGRAGLIGDLRQHTLLLAALDGPEGVATQLEVITLLVDREAPIPVDQDAVIHAGDEIVKSGLAPARLEPDIGHALEWDARPVIGVAAAARLLFTDQRGLLARGLVMLENALLDDREFAGLHAVIVIAGGGEAALIGAVAPDVDNVAANSMFAHLLSGEKAGAGVIRLITERSVELGGVTDTLVDRKPQVAGKQDQILLAGSNGRGIGVLGDFLPNAAAGFHQVHHGALSGSGGRLRWHLT